MKNFIIFSSIILLSSCGESTEEANYRGYEEGYYDGIEKGKREICDNIEVRFDTLKYRWGC